VTEPSPARVFAPSLFFTLVTIGLLVLFVSLGRWQWGRGVLKQEQWDAFAAHRDEFRSLDAASAAAELAKLPRFALVALNGRFDGERQFLLDNRSFEGRPGYEVLTVLKLTSGAGLLVNRGWLPASGFREQLPDIGLAVDVIDRRVRGRIDQLPTAGLESGRAAPALGGNWPRVTSYPRAAELAAAYGSELLPGMLLLDERDPNGFTRQWKPPGLEPARHKSYAIQWWGFAVLLLVLYFGLNYRRVEPKA
jgi:surfeit locus 1 family protein